MIKVLRKSMIFLLAAVMFVGTLPILDYAAKPSSGIYTAEATAPNGVYRRLISLKNKYPQDKFWNHVVPAAEAGVDTEDESYADHYTDTPCAIHHAVNPGAGSYDCNYFDGGWQCCGFARKVFNEVFGQRANNLAKTYGPSGLRVGDFVAFNGTEHYAVVLTVSSDSFTVVECNLEGYGAQFNCKINWGRTCYFSQVEYYVRATNYDDINKRCETHTWDKGKVTKEAKCTNDKLINGKKTYTCTVCGEAKTEVIKASHDFKVIKTKKATLKQNGKVQKKCSKCGKITTTKILLPKTIKMKKSLVAVNGKSQKPGVIIKDLSGKAVPKGNYSVSYLNNTKIGTATAIVTFKGNYSGIKKLSFKIGPKGAEMNKISGGQKKVTVRWNQRSGIDGYEIQYATRKDFKNKKTVQVKGNKNRQIEINKLKAGTNYYIRVRTYKIINKKKSYSPWSKVKSAKTKAGTFSTPEGIQYQIVKYKNQVYCGMGNKLVCVNLNTKKTKTLAMMEADYLGVSDMMVKDNYLYYIGNDGEDFTYASLYRIKLNGNDNKLLHSGKENLDHGRFLGYKMKNKRLYLLVEYYTKEGKFAGYSMDYDGSNKKVDAYFEKVTDWNVWKESFDNYEKKHKTCNVKGYSTEESWKEIGEYSYEITEWLVTPNGKIKIGSYTF